MSQYARTAPANPAWRRAQSQTILDQYSTDTLESLAKEHGSPLLILSLKTIQDQYKTLQTLMPRVKHHYAMKPLPHPRVVETIRDMDGYFDIATSGEIDVVREKKIDPGRCIHSHPIKRPKDIEYALAYGITRFVFDNEDELEKMLPYKDDLELIMRVSFPNKDAQCDLSAKFGVHRDQSFELLQKADDMGFTVMGLSFHVGSQIPAPAKHIEAITFCLELMESARHAGIDTIRMMDIGGGWPVTYTDEIMSMEEFVAPINALLETIDDDIEIYSEPGRFIAGPSVTLICSVMGKTMRNGKPYYYLDDGLYNSYSGIMFDHGDYLVYSVEELKNPEVETFESTLAGPTCDSIDVMYTDMPMPNMKPGDLLVSPCMGAYAGHSHATDFNYFMRPKMIVLEEIMGEELVLKTFSVRTNRSFVGALARMKRMVPSPVRGWAMNLLRSASRAQVGR